MLAELDVYCVMGAVHRQFKCFLPNLLSIWRHRLRLEKGWV